MSRSDRFLPTLLDRLVESPENGKGGMSRQAYQQSVLRDLQWLLCSVAPREQTSFAKHAEASRSVLNYGIPCSTGMTLTERELTKLAQDIEKAILTYEPRVLPESLSVALLADSEQAVRSQLVFRIRLAFWFEPYPLELSVRAQWDIENGLVSLSGE
ncbi:type VI secretion system baseplate subunit TssE [Thauera butanivorans]|uniref:type VI secretion system baseplate subunit TssE n=1 Tax=Thauera butanivorans TaxID=86174 RepID=UPI003AB2532E